ncbi:NUDIX domain-containing protein [Streptomyces sp. NPDC001691]|uniref:NUDIX domain-containing protein n=1 Tax=Streptomyces sp. NPDC001691 TaxID=3364600 RepID=UPI0036C230BA
MTTPRLSAIVFAGIILENQHGHVLLQRRANTGFADGLWSLPGGVVDPGELLVQTAAREAQEELGIDIDTHHLCTAHVLNKITEAGVPVVGWYFHTRRWTGEPRNREPDRCSAIEWADPRRLDPALTEDTDRLALHAWLGGTLTT